MTSRLWTFFILSLADAAAIARIVTLMHEKDIRAARNLAGFFKTQSKSGRMVLGMFFRAMWIIASVKPEGGNAGESCFLTQSGPTAPRAGMQMWITFCLTQSHGGTEKGKTASPPPLRCAASRTVGRNVCTKKLTQSDPTALRAGAFIRINGIL